MRRRLAIFLMSLCGACASTSGSYSSTMPRDQVMSTKGFRHLSVLAEAAPQTNVPYDARTRIAKKVVDVIKERAPERFADTTSSSLDGGTLRVHIRVRRYDEGNASARFLLAGLGAMHIDADVTLEGSGKVLNRFDVTKTFAWGGFYGGSTAIEDIEPGFAKAVAAAVLDDADRSP